MAFVVGLLLGACGDDDSTATTAVATDAPVSTSVLDTAVSPTKPSSSPGLPATGAPATSRPATAPVALTIGQIEAYVAEQWPGSAFAPHGR